MTVVRLTDDVVELEVEVSPLEETPERPWTGSVGVTLARNLQMLRAPDALVRDVALATVGARSDVVWSPLSHEVDQFLTARAAECEIISSEVVSLPLVVLGAAAPPDAESSVTATMAVQGSGEGGLEVKLGGFGVKGGVKYALKRELEIKCGAGQARLGSLLIPAILEVRSWRPPGSGEDFPMKYLKPSSDLTQIGDRANNVDVREVMVGASHPAVPIGGGDAPLSDSLTRTREISWSLELGLNLGEANKFTVSASVTGLLEETAEYTVPGGSFQLYWLTRPTGACVTSAAR